MFDGTYDVTILGIGPAGLQAAIKDGIVDEWNNGP